jgi:hypothetical protein
MKIKLKTLLAPLVIWAAAGAANAQSFSCVTSSNSCANGGTPQLSWSLNGTQLSIFNNAASGSGSFISAIGFDYASGMDVLSIAPTPGVSFQLSQGAPNGLPGPELGLVFDESAYRTNIQGAVRGGESVIFNLSGVTIADIGSRFKFGMHVQGLAVGSEKWVANTVTPVTAVPEPETYALMLAGLGLVGAIARRRKAKQA